MPDKFLRASEVAAMLGTTPGVAASVLEQHGVRAVNFGPGRSRGRRWMESAVQQVIVDMHAAAQPKSRVRMAKHTDVVLSDMTVDQIYKLTGADGIQ